MQKLYYNKLDGLRAFAVLGVMISHWVHLDFVKKLGLGFWGVNLFFVLSGFLITEILLKQICRKEHNGEILKKFYIKRTLRIFPIYYLVIFFAFFLNLDNSRNLSVYSFTYTLNIYNSFSGDVGLYLSHIWSLCVEEQFYLLWPLLLLLTKPVHHRKLILSAIVGAILFRFILFIFKIPHYSIYNYRMMPGCMDALGLGALLAYLKLNRTDWVVLFLKKNYIPLLSLSIFITIVFFLDGDSLITEVFLRFLVSVCSFFLVGTSLYHMKNRFGSLLENRIIQFFGKISYGLYLYHLIISSLLSDWFSSYWDSVRTFVPGILGYNSYIVSFPLYLSITILSASLSYYIIERPFLRVKEKLENKWTQKSNLLSSAAAV